MATRLIRGLVLGMLGAFAAGGLVVGLAQTFVADLGGGQAGFGVMFGAVFTGLAVGMWVGPRVLAGFSRRRLFGLAMSAAGVFLVLLALVPNLVLAVLFTVTLGICGGIAWVTGYTLLGLEVNDEVRGRTFAFVHSAARVVLVLALAGRPALAAGVGRHTLVLPWNEQLVYNGGAWVLGLAGVIAIAVGALAYRAMDDRPGSRLRSDLVAAWAVSLTPSLRVTSATGAPDSTWRKAVLICSAEKRDFLIAVLLHRTAIASGSEIILGPVFGRKTRREWADGAA